MALSRNSLICAALFRLTALAPEFEDPKSISDSEAVTAEARSAAMAPREAYASAATLSAMLSFVGSSADF